MILKSTGELIGDCGVTVQIVDGIDELEVGYHLRRDHWGQAMPPKRRGPAVIGRLRIGMQTYVISLIRREFAGRAASLSVFMSLWKESSGATCRTGLQSASNAGPCIPIRKRPITAGPRRFGGIALAPVIATQVVPHFQFVDAITICTVTPQSPINSPVDFRIMAKDRARLPCSGGGCVRSTPPRQPDRTEPGSNAWSRRQSRISKASASSGTTRAVEGAAFPG